MFVGIQTNKGDILQKRKITLKEEKMHSAKVACYCDELFTRTFFLESPSLLDVVRDITEDLFQKASIAASELQQIDIPCKSSQHGESDDILYAVGQVVEELFQEASTALKSLPSTFEHVSEDNEITEKAKDVFEIRPSQEKSHTCQRYNTLPDVCNDPSPSSPDLPISQEMLCSNEVGIPHIDEPALARKLYDEVRELDASLVEGESVRKEENNANQHQHDKEITTFLSNLTDAETGIGQQPDSKQSRDGSTQLLTEEDKLSEYIQMVQTCSPRFHVSRECCQEEQDCSLDPAGRTLEEPPCKMSKLDEHLGISETSVMVERGTGQSVLVTSSNDSNPVCDEGKSSFSEPEAILNPATVPLGASQEISDTGGCSEKTPKPVCSDEELLAFEIEDGSSVAHVTSHDYVRFAIDKVYSYDDKELEMNCAPTTLLGDLGQELQEAMKLCQDQTVPSLQEEVDNCIRGNSVNGLYAMDEETPISGDVKHTEVEGAFPNVNEIEDQTVTEKIPDVSDNVEQKIETGGNQQVPLSSLPLFHWRTSIDYQNQQPPLPVQPGVALSEQRAPGVDWRPRPLPPCNRKRRIGLSRRQRVTHLHSVGHSPCQQIQQQGEPAQKQEE